ncbi:MAG: Firmicutes ribosomal L7Ae family protein [Brockia lithotrophica]|uniref:Firmicutes ribosomal L7Ae family protein n=1 Tax=Brockia lithotrophica TaxID=933949 RepID=A0A2T5G4Y8_9BACL|nr:ribosomal L7Ae/L30e/S12e/Gadd45 family protein [Brockia lithotrophica]PTQ51256.1 MAG: Firmicutes ribosomal L7Ae family protein [Brockia lithotrophica]
MAYDELRRAPRRIVGARAVRRALEAGGVRLVVVARDAEEHVIAPIVALARRTGVPIELVDSMVELGRASGIDVGASVVALPQEEG